MITENTESNVLKTGDNGNKTKRIACGAMTLILLVVMIFFTPLRGYVYGLFQSDKIYIPERIYVNSSPNLKEIEHTFYIYNLRPKPLHLKLEPSCGCIRTTWRTTDIRPFGFTLLTASMAVSEVSAEQSVAIHSDDLKLPYIFVFLKH